MNEQEKNAVIAGVEKLQAIDDFLNDWYSVTDLYETAANAANVLMEAAHLHQFSHDDLGYLNRLLDQHVMLANLLKKVQGDGRGTE